MLNRMSVLLTFLLLGGVASSAMEEPEVVTILLHNGDKIEARISQVRSDLVEFRATSSKKAYEYGEVLSVERIKGIKLKNDMVFSVNEYRAYLRDGAASKSLEQTIEKPAVVPAVAKLPPGADPHYEALKNKPISEMSENEFEYFMMKKQEEEIAQSAGNPEPAPAAMPEKPLPKIQPSVVLPEPATPNPQAATSTAANRGHDELVGTIIEAGLAPDLLNYLNEKSGRGEALSAAEAGVVERIQNSSKWQEKIDDVKYLDRVSYKALERAYLYNPDDLQNKLSLKFDRDAEMNFNDLMDQLHRRMGSDIRISDFRVLVELFEESGGRAVKDLLENYDTWEFITQGNSQLSDKN
jgi:hypothetical protein